MANGTIPAGFEVGKLLLLDGKVWAVTVVSEAQASAERTEVLPDQSEKTLRVHFDARELVSMGADFFGLVGRIEPPSVPDGAHVMDVAVADGTAPQP